MFSDQALTWPKMSGSWGKQRNALYQPLYLSWTSSTSDVVCEISGQGQQDPKDVVYGLHLMTGPATGFKSSKQRSLDRCFVQDLRKDPECDCLIFNPRSWHCTEKPLSVVWKRQHQREPIKEKKLYQVGVLIQTIRAPILIQLQQNTLKRLFLNTAWTKRVKIWRIYVHFFFHSKKT